MCGQRSPARASATERCGGPHGWRASTPALRSPRSGKPLRVAGHRLGTCGLSVRRISGQIINIASQARAIVLLGLHHARHEPVRTRVAPAPRSRLSFFCPRFVLASGAFGRAATTEFISLIMPYPAFQPSRWKCFAWRCLPVFLLRYLRVAAGGAAMQSRGHSCAVWRRLAAALVGRSCCKRFGRFGPVAADLCAYRAGGCAGMITAAHLQPDPHHP